MKRPQLMALREQLDTLDVLIAYELDRFSRNRRDYFNLK
jgi:DNA invertase Pin-like site-specific DNA recombinase